MQFRHWVEGFQFSDRQAREKLSQHPYAQQSGVGVEIELIADLTPQQWARVQSDSDGDYSPEEEAREVVEIWTPQIVDLIQSAGFRYSGSDKASGPLWGVGPDNLDSEEGKPVLEIRTGIISARDLSKFANFLFALTQAVKRHSPYLALRSNTGLHVHVSNPGVGTDLNRDAFVRLAALSDIDEPHIWKDMTPYDRPFELYAKLNKQTKLGMSGVRDYHDSVIERFKTLLNVLEGQPFSRELNNKQLATILQGMDRHAGINISGSMPGDTKPNTVEYRHLTSAMLLEPNGVEKLIDYINYYIQHLARKSRSSQVVIQGTTSRLVFTRMPYGRVKVDYQPNTQKSRVAQAGLPFNDLSKPSTGRGDRPFSAWWGGLNKSQQTDYKLSKANPGSLQ